MSDQTDAAEFAQRAGTKLPSPLSNRAKPDESAVLEGGQGKEETPHGVVCQYSEYGSGYKAVSKTTPSLPNGCYDICADNNGIFVVPTLPPTGLLLELPEMRSEHVVNLVESFWASEKDYKDGNEFVYGGAAYKAGVMLFGPPGSGKSCTIKIVSKKLIERGGTVFNADVGPSLINTWLADFSRVERNRKCIVILEDFDSLVQKFGEDGYLAMLDGSRSIDNVLFIATTNYPERLDPRIFNRPGRFAHVVKIGLPTSAAREAYLKAILKNHRDVKRIVGLTENFSVDHLASLVNGVYREKKQLDSEIERLRKLFKVPEAEDKKVMGM